MLVTGDDSQENHFAPQIKYVYNPQHCVNKITREIKFIEASLVPVSRINPAS